MDDFTVECVRSQVDAFIAELEKIEASEFPYPHSRECVTETKRLLLKHSETLAQVPPVITPRNVGMVEMICNAAQMDVKNNLPLLGFLLRSTNVRNAFEAYGPLLRMARDTLGSQTRLVMSSEWKFSPFTYIGVPHLQDTVFVGMPAMESGNPLLLPLAGHEFGHTAWEASFMSDQFKPKLEEAIIDDIKANWASLGKHLPSCKKKEDVPMNLLARGFWVASLTWATSQCEEYFCDCLGLLLFGEGFLHAFSYLLAAGKKSLRSELYPALRDRAKVLALGATSLHLQAPAGYAMRFAELPSFPPDAERENAQLALADRVSEKLWPELFARAGSLLATANLPLHSEERIEANLKRLALHVPAQEAGGLANIITAAWRAVLDPQKIGLASMNRPSRQMLAEMVWKSIEIDEIEYRLAQS